MNINKNNIPDDDININKNKNDIILNTINNILYKDNLINKIFEVIKKNDNYYNSNENAKNEEECSLLNILLNLMDIRFAYENAVLYNYFFRGLKIIIPNSKKNFQNFSDKNDIIINYLKLLFEKEKKLKLDIKKIENLRKYYNLCKKFSSIKNLDNYLNSIIIKNMKVEQSINEIKNVLNDEKRINDKNINGMNNDINKKRIFEQYLNRNKSNSTNSIDKFSFYTTNYYNNNKIHDQNYNNDKLKNYLKKNKSQSQIKTSNNTKNTKIINTNFNNYIKSKNKRSMNQIKKSCSKTITINNNKRPKNFNKLYSYSVSNNSKGNFNFN